MPVVKRLIVLWLIAVAAIMAATASASASAAASPESDVFDLYLSSEPTTQRFDNEPHWILTLQVLERRANPGPIRDVKVQLSVEPEGLLHREGWFPNFVDGTTNQDGRLDPQTGVWSIPVLPASGTATMQINGARILGRTVQGVGLQHVRLHAEIISSDPMEQPPSPANNETEAWYGVAYLPGVEFTVADPGVNLELVSMADDASSIQIVVDNAGAGRGHPGLTGPGTPYNNAATRVQVQYELSEGLEFASAPSPPVIREINDRTRLWGVGTVPVDSLFYPRLDVPVRLSAFPSLEELPLNERCLTARVARALPAFKLDLSKRANDVGKICMEDPWEILSAGEVDLWWVHDCVNTSGLPCRDGDTLKLLVRTQSGTYGRYREPDSVIFHLDDVVARSYDVHTASVTAQNRVSWSTDGLITLRDMLANLDGTKGYWDSYGPFVVTANGWNGGSAPGMARVRFANSKNTFFDPNPTSTEDWSFGNQDEDAYLEIPIRIFFEFSELGTYTLNYRLSAVHTDGNTYTDDANYFFHVGPMAELAVNDGDVESPLGRAGQMAYTVHAANHGPDAPKAVQVHLIDVPQGAEGIATDGTYEEQEETCAVGLCEAIWRLGSLPISDIRPAKGQTEFPALTIIAPDGAPTPEIQASIESTQDYSVVIDGNTHSTPYFDYIEENNTAVIAPRPGAGGPPPGTPERLNARTYPDPPFALVSWNPVERLNGWPVSRYEVRASAPPCQPPAPGAEATATVGGELYLDTGPDAGQDKCYAVRAVNERGIPGYWSMVSVGGDRGATMTPQSLTVAENGGTGHYTVVLDAQPRSTVTVTFASADTDVATVRSALSDSRLLFGPGNWDIPQRVTVTGVDDDIDNPDDRRSTIIWHSLSGGGYDNVSAPSVVVTVTDDDPGTGPQQRTATVSKSSLTLAEESGTDTYTVSLSHPSDGPVELNFTADGPVTVSPPRHTFATGGLGPKTITVTAVDDGGEANPGGQRPATIRHTLSGGGYGGVPVPNVSVAVLDGDVPARVSKSADSLTISEAGGSGSYTVSLNKRPTGLMTVRLSVTGADPGAVRVTPAALAFTPENWQTPQTVTAVGDDDEAVTGARHATIEHAVVGGGYDGVSLGPVAVTISDNDVAEISLSEAGPSLSLSEAGPRSATYQVSLSNRPTSEVKVSISSDDESVVQVSPSEATFGPSDWNVPYVITVTVQGDGVDNPDDRRAATIRHEASGGGEFDGVAKEIAVTVADDDEAGLRIAECIGGANRDRCSNDPGDVRWQEPGGEITWSVSEDGERQTTGMLTRQFCIALGSAPADGIWLAVESSNPSVARPVGSTVFRIDNGNWNNCVERFSADSSTGLLPLVRLMIGRPAGDGRATAEAPPVGAEATITLLIRQERDGDGAHYSEGFRADYTLRIVE